MVDLRAQYHAHKEEIDRAISSVLESTAFIGGEACRTFEREFAKFCRAEAAAGVANGSDALYLSLRALGVGAGDEVVTTPFTFIATAEAISRNGSRIVFADIDQATFNLSPSATESALTPRTKALLPVHLYGHPADMDGFGDLARRHGVPVVEDAAQAHGAEWKGQRVGTFGRVACFSSFPSKNLGAFGDAGVVVSNDVALVESIRKLANHGSTKKYHHEIEGISSRLDALQAAILTVKLRHLEDWNERRRRVARLYDEAFSDLEDVVRPAEARSARHVYHLYTLRYRDREGLRAHLEAKGIGTAVHYPVPLHLQPAYAYLGYAEGSFPVSERAAKEVLSLPMFPELTTDQVERIASEVRAYVRPRK